MAEAAWEPQVSSVTDAVAAAGGIIRRSRLRSDGYTQRAIVAAVAAGSLTVVRRVWLALPGADPYLVAAARSGVVVSCVSRARRLGLWVPGAERNAHVAAHPHAGRVEVAEGTRVHRAVPVAPRDPAVLEDTIHNVLALVCACQPYESARAIVESALNKGLVQKHVLLGLPVGTGILSVFEAASPFSDSGLETYVLTRLRWLKLRIVPQAWIEGHRVDFLIGDRLVLQIDGGHHVGRQRASDNAHDARLRHAGYHVIRVGFIDIVEDWPGVQARIMEAVALGLHRTRRA